MREIQKKNLSLEVKDVDSKTRRVKVALSAFDNVDSDFDVIRQGAFSKSIKERGPETVSSRKIAFLRYHDWEHQIGKWVSLEETREYLIGIGDLGRSTKGNDALLDYQDGLILEHSIGFETVLDKARTIDVGGVNVTEINEVILWEGSAVTFGANQNTFTIDVSKGFSKENLERINEKMSKLASAIRSGGTDERLFSLEMQIKTLKDAYNDIISSLEVKEPQITPTPEPNKDLINFYKHLK